MAIVLVSLGVLLVVVGSVVACIACRGKKTEEEVDEEKIDENPVYQQYELVGPNYERQYSTHEVVDSNTYYES